MCSRSFGLRASTLPACQVGFEFVWASAKFSFQTQNRLDQLCHEYREVPPPQAVSFKKFKKGTRSAETEKEAEKAGNNLGACWFSDGSVVKQGTFMFYSGERFASLPADSKRFEGARSFHQLSAEGQNVPRRRQTLGRARMRANCGVGDESWSCLVFKRSSWSANRSWILISVSNTAKRSRHDSNDATPASRKSNCSNAT